MPPNKYDLGSLIEKLGDIVIGEIPSQFPQLFPPVSVRGIEVTQSIQYYRSDEHLTDPADQGADNAVTLIANKAAWVRVYVRSSSASPVNGVTGLLTVTRSGFFTGGSPGTFTVNPQPPASIVAEKSAAYTLQRSTIGSTLNFIIPADEMVGHLTLDVEVWAASNTSRIATKSVQVDATLRQTLSLRGILISYNGPDGSPVANQLSLAAPTLANLVTTADHVLAVAPLARDANFSSAGTLDWGTPLTGVALSPGGCSQEWLDLNAAIAEVRTNDGNRDDVIYFGLLPVGIPIDNVGGCASSDVTSGTNGDGVTMAHEIGHAAGLNHAACNTPGDPDYPAYEPYDAASPGSSLGEYGLDIRTGAIHQPGESDLMGYCGGQWFSLYHYAKLTNNARFNPTSTYRDPRFEVPVLVDPYLWPWEYIPDPGPDDPYPGYWRAKPMDLISLIGIVERSGEVRVRSVQRVRALPSISRGVASDLRVELIDGAGATISSAPLTALPSQGGRCGCGGGGGGDPLRGPFVFQALVPARDDFAEIRIVDEVRERALRTDERGRERATVWRRASPGSPPRLDGFRVTIEGDQGFASWRADVASDTPSASLRFSKDNGRSWNSVAVGLTGSEARFATEPLPADKLIFQLAVSDGFHTAQIESDPVEIPERPHIVAIQGPREGARLVVGSPMRLAATLLTRDGTRPDDRETRWQVDGKDVGRGRELWIEAPAAGRHEAVVRSGDARASVAFTTIDAARDAR